jgi:predicted permease
LVLAAVITVGVGLGPHVAVFGLFDRLILRPLPFHKPGRLVQIQLVVSRGGRHPQASLPFDYASALAERRDTFAGLAYASGSPATYPVPGENPLVLSALTPNALEVLGITPALGRDFVEADLSDRLSKPILLTYETWTGRFHASDRVLGQSWKDRSVAYRIIGILPRHFILPSSRLLERIDGVVPFRTVSLPGQLITAPFARLQPGVSVAEAREAARAAVSMMHWEGTDEPKPGDPAAGLDVRPLQSGIAALVEPYLWLLFGAVWLVFVVASINLAVLLHTWQRLRETQTGIRIALGATLGRLLRSVFLETAVVCGVGALVAWTCYRVVQVELLAIVPPSLRGFAVSATDGRVIGTTILGALLAAIAVSVVPLRAALSVDLLNVLHGRQARGRGRATLPATLLGIEAALACAVLVCATATVPGYVAFLIGSPGFEAADRHVAYIDHDWPEADGAAAPGPSDRVAAILGAVSGLPGVDGAAVALAFDPLGGEPTDILRRELPQQDARLLPVSAGYFDVAGMRLVVGRPFGDREVDDRAPVVVLNETAARELWPGRSLPEALGQEVLTGDLRRALVGVVADSSKYPGAPVEPTVFVPFTSIEGPRHGSDVPVLLRMSPGRMLNPSLLKARLDRLFPPRRVRIESVEESLRPWLETPRLLAVLLGVAGLSAIALVATALYAVTHFEVKRRTAELRIRSLLGAAGWQVRLVVLRVVLLPVAVGTIGGALVLAAILTRWQWLGSDDRLLAYGGAGLAVVATAAAAAWLPTSRIVTSPGGTILRSN